MVICPYCNNQFKTLKRASFHVSRCSMGSMDDAARILLYSTYFKYRKEDLIQDYIEREKGLSCITKEKGIPFKILKFLAIQYGILRTKQHTYSLSIEKTRSTLLKRYGTSNPLQTFNAQIKMKEKIRDISKKRSESMKKIWSDKRYHDTTLKSMKNGVINKFKVDNVFKLRSIQDKATKSIQLRFGVSNISQSKYKKDLLVSLGKYTPDKDKTKYIRYKEKVRKITYKYAKILKDLWILSDRRCYYTLDLLLDENDTAIGDFKNKPTIDHKVSILFGFLNGIPPEVIGHYKNLCICSSYINSLKRSLTEIQFRGAYPEICFSERYFG